MVGLTEDKTFQLPHNRGARSFVMRSVYPTHASQGNGSQDLAQHPEEAWKPAAKAALQRLLRKKPATGVKLSLGLLDKGCSWPVFGLAEYSFLKVKSAELSKAGFYGITYLLCKNSKSTQQRKDREPFADPLRLDINKQDGRLSVNACPSGSRKRRINTRLLGLSFLHSCWDDNGKLLARPRFLGVSLTHVACLNFSLSCFQVEV